MKNLMNLKGAKILNRIEQKSVNGGGGTLCISSCGPGVPGTCGSNQVCHSFMCFGGSGDHNEDLVYYCVGEGPGNQ